MLAPERALLMPAEFDITSWAAALFAAETSRCGIHHHGGQGPDQTSTGTGSASSRHAGYER